MYSLSTNATKSGAVNGGMAYYKTGDNCDVITFGSKDFAFSYGIRTMAPDVIVTDEIMSEEDALAVLMAMGGGVRVLASAHAHSPEEFKTKPFLKLLLSSKCIERYIFLSAKEIGKVAGVYDREFGRIKMTRIIFTIAITTAIGFFIGKYFYSAYRDRRLYYSALTDFVSTLSNNLSFKQEKLSDVVLSYKQKTNKIFAEQLGKFFQLYIKRRRFSITCDAMKKNSAMDGKFF